MACRLNRLIRIIRLVRTRAFPTVEYLCDMFQIKERTFFNDLKELREDLGVDIQFDKIRRGYYIASDIAELNFISLNEESVYLLTAAIGLLNSHGGPEFAAPLKLSFDDELKFCLSSEIRDSKIAFGDIIETVNVEQLDKNVFVELCKACLKQQSVKLKLKLAGDEYETLEITPACLIYTAEGWKLRYIDNSDGTAPRVLPLVQISSFELITKT